MWRGGVGRRGTHGHVVGDHRDLGLEIDAPGFVGERHVVARAEQIVRAALVDQRIGPERGRHFRATRLAHQLHVIDVGAAVHPVIGARQRRGALSDVEGHGARQRRAGFQRGGALGEPRRECVPVVERRLQRRRRCRAPAGNGVRSRLTTTSRPSRPPRLRVASFITTCPSLWSLPAVDVSGPLDLRGARRDLERIARVDHHGVFVGGGLGLLEDILAAPWDAGRA